MARSKNLSTAGLILLAAFFLFSALPFQAASAPEDSSAQPAVNAPPIGTPAPDLEYPTPDPTLVQDWRPPLYPVPWALTDNDHFFFIRPTAIDEINWPLANYPYGAIDFGANVPHTGVDYAVSPGTEVMAAGPGIVVETGYGVYRGIEDDSDPYGIAVLIRHDFGYQGQNLYTLYAHLSEVLVTEGQHVETGELIALSGNTGLTTGPHLHFEVRLGEKYYFSTRNPELWLSPPQGWGLIVGRLTTSSNEQLIEQSVKIIHLETNKSWVIQTYGLPHTINSDDYYKENFVASDLPAGTYEIRIPYEGITYVKQVTVHPGAVTYFRFQGRYSYTREEPYQPLPENIPYDLLDD